MLPSPEMVTRKVSGAPNRRRDLVHRRVDGEPAHGARKRTGPSRREGLHGQLYQGCVIVELVSPPSVHWRQVRPPGQFLGDGQSMHDSSGTVIIADPIDRSPAIVGYRIVET